MSSTCLLEHWLTFSGLAWLHVAWMMGICLAFACW